MRRVIIILILILLGDITYSQVNTNLTIKSESSLVINGSTNISKFKLTLDGRDFPGPEFRFITNLENERITLSRNKISLEVKKFHSGNILALNGFLDLINADQYPLLEIELKEIILNKPEANTSMSDIKEYSVKEGKAAVKITLTGETRSYEIPFKAERKKSEISGNGSLKLTIKDFGLVPPVAMMGLVKISEWIEIKIRFSLNVSY